MSHAVEDQRDGQGTRKWKDAESGIYENTELYLDGNHDADDALRRIRTAGNLSISPELFEKIYLSPQNKVSGDLRQTFGNPTPLAVVGFLLCLTPLSIALMGWRGSGNGSAGIGAYIGFGGLLMLLGGLGEWILGNTFPFVVFASFGGFWITFAITLMPDSGAFANFDPSDPYGGLATPAFNASWGFFLVFMGLLVIIYCIAALRTNLIFFLIFLFLIPTFGCLTGAYFYLAEGNPKPVMTLLKAGGACAFITAMLGWYIFVALILAAVDFPFDLPVFDLSQTIKGKSDRKKNE